MACYHPIEAFRTSDGSVVFNQLRRYDIVSTLRIACGQCVGCRLERSRQWAVRCMHEASLYDRNCFITLTYDEVNCPVDGGLRYTDWQKFMKRLRRRFPTSKPGIRFYMCGEYGPLHGRPHYHACIFNHDFPDKVYWRGTDANSKLYTSRILEELWPFGYSSVGEVTFESAAYVARYIMKKVTGDMAKTAYAYTDYETGEVKFVEPEFNGMSLKPGIGAAWLDKYSTDVYPHDRVVVRGKVCKPPKYYDKLLKRALDWYPVFSDLHLMEDELEFRRYQSFRPEDNTSERLSTREIVAKARLNQFARKVE